MSKYLINQHNNKDKHTKDNEQSYNVRARKKYLHRLHNNMKINLKYTNLYSTLTLYTLT